MKLSLSTKSLKGVRYGTTLRPSRDWLLLLALVIACLLVSIAWNLWTFSKVTEGESIGVTMPTQDAGMSSIDAVTALFEKRALEEARYKGEYRFVDPSTRPR